MTSYAQVRVLPCCIAAEGAAQYHEHKPKMKKGKAELIDKKAEALRLRRYGFGYAQIAKELGCAQSTAYSYVMSALAETRNAMQEDADVIRQMELERLDQMLPASLEKAKRGDDRAIRSVLSIMERRAKLLGLDAAGRLDVVGAGVVVNFVPVQKNDDD